MPEGLLHDAPGPSLLGPGQPGVSQEFHDLGIGLGRRRQIEDPVAMRAALPLDRLESGFQRLVESRIAEVPRNVLDGRRQVARPALRGRRELLRSSLEIRAKLLVLVWSAREADARAA